MRTTFSDQIPFLTSISVEPESGALTISAFSHVLSDSRTQGIPLILETPAHDLDAVWSTEIAALNHLSSTEVDLQKAESDIRAVVQIHGKKTIEKKRAGRAKGKKHKSREQDDHEDDSC